MGEVVVATDLAASVRLPSGQQLPIFRDLSITVSDGTSAAILGRSGSGKSTLLAILGLMNLPDAGELTIAGHAVSRLREGEAARLRNSLVGFVFQNYSLIEHLTVRENVELPYAFGASASNREIRSAAGRVLDLVGMTKFASRKPAQLSGGEQQRVAIARALVRSPRLILADEPTGALDVDTGHHVMEVLRDATAGSGSGLVVVTHDPAIADSTEAQWHLRDGSLHPAATRGGGL
ncbi:ABC transporter ATP-binding protein [Microbacterium sp. NPDC058389]|uniref:ABC transporter ATP-binding protein n=1 Tax=Microbacterium sp. NPDC058389 TaxID=3346475 RepID=UPI003646807D